MLLVLPVSKSDASLIPTLARAFDKLGGLSGQEALIVSIAENLDLAEDYASQIRHLFRLVTVHIIDGNCPTGWPQACNFYFARTAMYLEFVRKLHEPWYYFEADTTPLKPGWFEALETEYNLSGKPFMGVQQNTYRLHPVTSEVSTDGTHMVGTGIYPPDMSKYSVLYRYLEDVPWDVFCQWEIVPNMHATNLIQHNWSTSHYRKGPGNQVICDDYKDNRGGIKHNFPLRSDAMLLHGCKDTTLANLLLKDFVSPTDGHPTFPVLSAETMEELCQQVSNPTKAPEHVTAITDSTISALKADLSGLIKPLSPADMGFGLSDLLKPKK